MTRPLVFHVIGDHEYPIPSPDTRTSGRAGHKQPLASPGGDAGATHVHTTDKEHRHAHI